MCWRSFHLFTLFKVRADESNIRAKILFLWFKLRDKYQEENFKAEYFLSCGKNSAFSCRLYTAI